MSTLRIYPLLALSLAGSAVACSGTNSNDGVPGLMLERARVSFGAVGLGRSATEEVLLTNVGNGPLELTAASGTPSPEGSFAFSVVPAVVPSRGTAVLTVTFTPRAPSAARGQIILRTNVPGREEVPIELDGRGSGAPLTATSTRVDFGSVLLGSTPSQRVELQNTTGEELVVELLEGPGVELCAPPVVGEPFCIEPVGTGRVPPGGSAEIIVRFFASSVGRRAVTARVRGCTEDECALSLSLVGAVVAKPLVCEPSALSFETVEPGETSTEVLTCRNALSTETALVDARLSSNAGSTFSFAPPVQPRNLAPGEEFSLELTFSPDARGLAHGVLWLRAGGEVTSVTLEGLAGRQRLSIEPTSVDFGDVALGIPARRPLTLLNVGYENVTITDVLPDVDGSGAFFLSAGPVPGVPIRTSFVIPAGGARVVWVETRPATAGPVASQMRFRGTSGGGSIEMTVPLHANARLLPPCQFSVGPTPLDFGFVEVGRKVRRSIEVRNDGPDTCLVTAAYWVDTASDFTFPLPWTGTREIPAGSSTSIEIEFAPTRPGDFSRRLEIALSASSPYVALSVVGRTGHSGLLLSPRALDFGAVAPNCPQVQETFSIHNSGESSVRIDRLNFAGGEASPFVFLSPPVIGTSLSANQTRSVQLRLRDSRRAARYFDVLEIDVSWGSNSETFQVPVSARVSASDPNVDEVVQGGSGKADILFVLDATTSGVVTVPLASAFSALFDLAASLGVDYQVGVTTSEVGPDGTRGRLISAPVGSSYLSSVEGPADYLVVTSSTSPSPAAVFRSNASVLVRGGSALDESGLAAATLATLGGQARGLVRDDASLAMLVVSDEPDQSPASVGLYVDALRGTKLDANRVSLSSIAAPYPPGRCSGSAGSATSGGRYAEVARELGGDRVSICTANTWLAVMTDLAPELLGLRDTFILSHAVDPTRLTVSVDGVVVPQFGSNGQRQWTYDDTVPSVTLSAFLTPTPGQTVRFSAPPRCGR